MNEMGPETGGASAPARILVVDDEEVIHTSLRRLLGRQGHRVEAVFSAQEGLERLRGGGYDLVLTDMMMPEMDGIELLEQMRQRGLRIPVIMITGYPTIRTAMRALHLGAVDYVAKPFRRKELLGPVNRTLRREAGDAAAERAGPDSGDGELPERKSLLPGAGAVFYLRDHSWAEFQQDGTVHVGIEGSFLRSIGAVEAISLPDEAELVEQGYVGIRLTTSAGEEHGVFMPLSGQVVEINEQVAADPSAVDPRGWLVRIVPTAFDSEERFLSRRVAGA